MRTTNRFLTATRFLATARWRMRAGPFLVWPSLWVEGPIERGLEVRLTRWTLAWGRARWQWDWGQWRPQDPKRQLDWATDGLDAFLADTNQAQGSAFTRQDLEALLGAQPDLYRLIALGGPPAHYTAWVLTQALHERQGRSVAALTPGDLGEGWLEPHP